jgi:hypothetical protein
MALVADEHLAVGDGRGDEVVEADGVVEPIPGLVTVAAAEFAADVGGVEGTQGGAGRPLSAPRAAPPPTANRAPIRIPSAKRVRLSRNPCGGSDFRFDGRGRLTSAVRKLTFLLPAE